MKNEAASSLCVKYVEFVGKGVFADFRIQVFGHDIFLRW